MLCSFTAVAKQSVSCKFKDQYLCGYKSDTTLRNNIVWQRRQVDAKLLQLTEQKLPIGKHLQDYNKSISMLTFNSI